MNKEKRFKKNFAETKSFEQIPKKQPSWWPGSATNDTDLLYMFIAFLVQAYVFCFGTFVVGWKYVSLGILMLFFGMCWMDIQYEMSGLNKIEKLQSYSKRIILVLILVSPLLRMYFKYWQSGFI